MDIEQLKKLLDIICSKQLDVSELNIALRDDRCVHVAANSLDYRVTEEIIKAGFRINVDLGGAVICAVVDKG